MTRTVTVLHSWGGPGLDIGARGDVLAVLSGVPNGQGDRYGSARIVCPGAAIVRDGLAVAVVPDDADADLVARLLGDGGVPYGVVACVSVSPALSDWLAAHGVPGRPGWALAQPADGWALTYDVVPTPDGPSLVPGSVPPTGWTDAAPVAPVAAARRPRGRRSRS